MRGIAEKPGFFPRMKYPPRRKNPGFFPVLSAPRGHENFFDLLTIAMWLISGIRTRTEFPNIHFYSL
ncbi:Uncharacterized protein dnm_008320 [Desulfonema magnum]|uniref:Uncharacterized protein n=1 Tax=Desulfonema magnum TaxID=45655 RepID=A0A975BGA5_9BACT|nr:Uncharacterized protein dnm_008320 [Desulfonema magnum]